MKPEREMTVGGHTRRRQLCDQSDIYIYKPIVARDGQIHQKLDRQGDFLPENLEDRSGTQQRRAEHSFPAGPHLLLLHSGHRPVGSKAICI